MSANDARVVHTLHPGDVVVAQRGDRLETLLGSCIAVVLTDPRRTVATMCHIVHAGAVLDAARTDTTHADAALRRSSALLVSRGITPRLCDAYVFGGGNMFPDIRDRLCVGEVNAAWALAAMQSLGVRVVGVDVGGTVYRRLAWTVGPGEPEVVTVAVAAGAAAVAAIAVAACPTTPGALPFLPPHPPPPLA